MSLLKRRAKIPLHFVELAFYLNFSMSMFRLCSTAHKEQMGKLCSLPVPPVSDLYNRVDIIHIRCIKRRG